MIFKLTKLLVTDNTGARLGLCIGLFRGVSKRKGVRLGEIIKVSLQDVVPNRKLAKGEIHRALVIRTKETFKRTSFLSISMPGSDIILLKKGDLPRGKRIYGPVLSELRSKGFAKVLAIAPLIV
jgi:large subunit ribosomal protein L14